MISIVNVASREQMSFNNPLRKNGAVSNSHIITQATEEKEKIVRNNASVYDIYLAQQFRTAKPIQVTGGEVKEDIAEEPTDKKPQKTTYYQGIPLETWALTDPKYPDKETGISWYVRDGKFPYMLGEDAEKFRKMCEENGEFALKKFAEMTGLIQQLDENTIAYVGDNGIAVKSKDGQELFIDTSQITYDLIMDMFKNLRRTNDYFSNKYWADNIKRVMN